MDISKCKIPNDCYGCFLYDTCPGMEEYRENHPGQIFITIGFLLSLILGIGVAIAAIAGWL